MRDYSCGTIIPSGCVPFTGKKLNFLPDNQQPACDANINDVIEKVDAALDSIQKAIDVSLHSFDCGTLQSPKTAAKVLQAHADKICALAASVTALQSIIANENIANEHVTINLGTLAAAASPCQVGTNTYTLISVLNLLVSQIISIKTTLGI
jgi:hypothetical protein